MSEDVAHLPMPVPSPRGPISAGVLTLLAGDPTGAGGLDSAAEQALAQPSADLLHDGDRQLALMLLHELHFRGIEGVDDQWEWHPEALRISRLLEAELEAELRTRAGTVLAEAEQALGEASVADVLLYLTAPTSKPQLAGHLAREATLEEYRELLINRSVYQLKEADPHTFAIPRLSGAAKAALVEIQSDEYGGGRPEWVHATLFARTMRAVGLESRYGFYLDQVAAESLAALNAITFFGLHRRLRGAVAGHLAVLEMTSTLPNRLYAQGLRRLGLGDDAAGYFDEHVEADAVHEQIALQDLVGELLRAEPDCAGEVLFGAATAVALDSVVSDHLLQSWTTARAVPVS